MTIPKLINSSWISPHPWLYICILIAENKWSSGQSTCFGIIHYTLGFISWLFTEGVLESNGMLNDGFYAENCTYRRYQVILKYLITSNNFKHINPYLQKYCSNFRIKNRPLFLSINAWMQQCEFIWLMKIVFSLVENSELFLCISILVECPSSSMQEIKSIM